ncbi:MAG: tRNA (cytosine(32)/uridine(32)-2'-O)-methyltransferase TrmJ [Gammaproteobacteria bacterium]
MEKNIKIVLVNTSHPGNIGSAARAMKTMGLSQLALVSPKTFPSEKAIAMSAGADDVLSQAVVHDTLFDAIKDCQLVIASSARDRERPWPMLTPKACAEKLVQESQAAQTALVFGAERAGLTNEELAYAQFHVMIPTSKVYRALNLAAAVQVLCYEIQLAELAVDNEPVEDDSSEYSDIKDVELFYEHLASVLRTTGFLDAVAPKYLMMKLRRLFNRVRLEKKEVNMLRGVLSSVENTIRQRSKSD